MLQPVDMSGLSAFHNAEHICSTPSRGSKCWLAELSRPERKVVFASTDLAGDTATETLNPGKNITNDFEATITAQLVLSFLAIGVPAKEIGVIALYRSQLALMRRLFKIAGISSEVEIDSADRFQGRDKECVILSMVRSNDAGIVGDLLKDWRRVNVALTRARSKLVVLGSGKTLQNNELLAKFLGLVDEKGWSVDLPKDADVCHLFNFSSQVASEIISTGKSTPAKKVAKASPKIKTPMASPQKLAGTPQSGILKESPSAANRNASGLKRPGKVIHGRSSQSKKQVLEEAAFFIFEDLTADDL
jgi:DNA replication ATP-dependent helicase Dna2